MSIFSNTRFDDDITVIENCNLHLGGAYDIVAESCDDDLAIVEAMHAYDIAELEAMKESGTSVGFEATPAMEAASKGVWAKIKEFFAKLKNKIIAFFNSVVQYIDAFVKSGSEFAKKYKDRLNKLKLSNFYYEMYRYDYHSVFASDLSKIDKYQQDVKDNIAEVNKVDIKNSSAGVQLAKISQKHTDANDKNVSALRKELSGSTSADEFRQGVAKKFRGGNGKKRQSITNLSDYIKKLEASDGLMAYIGKCRDGVKSKFADIEKMINESANEVENGDIGENSEFASAASKKAAAMRINLKYTSAVNSVMTVYINEWASAVREATGVYKKLCVAALQHKNK